MAKVITIPLPHDLPENWNETQFVSPGGIEVGLTKQHGYNYLMEQVNNTQKAVLELEEKGSQALDSDLIYYVSSEGSDTIGSGSEDSPFLTIQKAIDEMPSNLNGKTVTVFVGEGTFQPFTVSNKHFGQVVLFRNPAMAEGVKPIISGSCKVAFCNSRVKINGFKINASDSKGCILVEAVNELFLHNSIFNGVNKEADGVRILSADVSCGIAYCVFENCANCVSTNHDSGSGGMCSVSIYTCTGSNNNYAIYNNFAVIGIYNSSVGTLGCSALLSLSYTGGPVYLNGQIYTAVASASVVE